MKRLLLLLLFALPLGAQISPGPLSEPHAKLEGAANCLKCHEAKRGVSPAKCLACHTALRARIQAKKGLHAQPNYQSCERCHNEHHGRAFKLIHWDPTNFDHRITGFPLEGTHAKAQCRECHKTRSFLGLSQSCTSCHSDPHKGQLTPCIRCHSMTAWTPAPKFDHATARFPLTGLHVKVACAKCHATAVFRGVAFQRCTGCHKDPHAGRFGTTCTQCHSTAGWTVQATANFDHAKTGFPLTGAHKSAPCAQCHRDRKFKGTPRACHSCHRDIHEGRMGKSCERCHSTSSFRAVSNFDHNRTRFPLTGQHTKTRCAQCHTAAQLRGLSLTCNGCHTDPHKGRLGNSCERCHSTASFTNVTSFDHDKTRFPLRGAHRDAKCDACHTTKGRALKFPRFDQCAGCHRDPHAGQLKGDCATCHTIERFLPSTFGVEEHQRTKFPLAGAHLAVPCNSCHAKKEKVTQFRVASSKCTACHRDPHRGETARFGACTSCHRIESWSRIAFDHARTGFPLEGAHARVRCAACHAKGFKGLPRACAACH
ncbi:MAG TPA: hypothetical protein VEK79_10885 [Thermoanaerobaculia bacterium]|nr:hypothetical protein [Thermoanaerobaculia bacterium]